MIFLTVGSQVPFDRLVKAVDRPENKGRIFAQIGASEYEPQHIEFRKFLEKDAFDTTLADAEAIISHAGMGTIIQAVSLGKPLLVLPRLSEFNEVVNDHQVVTARTFAEKGYLLAAYSEADVQHAITELEQFTCRPPDDGRARIIDHISSYLAGLDG